MSARTRWLRRANAWMGGKTSSGVPEEDEAVEPEAMGAPEAKDSPLNPPESFVSEGATPHLSRGWGWAARSGLGVFGAEGSRLELRKKELEVLHLTEQKLALEQEVLASREEAQQARRLLKDERDRGSTSLASIEKALEVKARLLEEREAEAAELRRQLQEAGDSMEETILRAAEVERLRDRVAEVSSWWRERGRRLRRLVEGVRRRREEEGMASEALHRDLQRVREERARAMDALDRLHGSGGELAELRAERERLEGVLREEGRRLSSETESRKAAEKALVTLERVRAEEGREAAAIRESIEKALEAVQGELENVREALSERDGQLASKEEVVEDLREALAEVRRRHQETLREAAEARAEGYDGSEATGEALREARALLQEREAEVMDRDQQVNTLQNELAGFASLLKEREARSARLEAKLGQMEEEHQKKEGALQRALTAAERSKEQWRTQLEDMRETLHAVSRELQGKRRQVEELDMRAGGLKQMEARLTAATEEGALWRRKATERESLLQEREVQIRSLQGQCKELEARLDDRSGLQVTKAVNERERLKAALEARDHEMREHGEWLNQARQELRTARRQLEERGREVAVVRKDLDLRKDSESRALSRARQSEKEAEGLRQQLAEQERRVAEVSALLERQRVKFVGEDEALSQRLVHLESALKDRERDLKASEGDVQKLRREMEILRADLRVSEAKIQQWQAESRKQGSAESITLPDESPRWKERLESYRASMEKLLEAKNAEIAKLREAREVADRGEKAATSPRET